MLNGNIIAVMSSLSMRKIYFIEGNGVVTAAMCSGINIFQSLKSGKKYKHHKIKTIQTVHTYLQWQGHEPQTMFNVKCKGKLVTKETKQH